ncbi:MAG TPA: aspartyl protease family protein, partial [Nitrososphaerales archaeon]|nr:aspartyl protease family protein [Nitrososphaerales archaeon]
MSVSDPEDDRKVIRLVAKVSIAGPGGEESVRAKVDTGADRTTVDRELAARLKLGLTGSKVMVKTLGGSHKL